MIRTSSLVSVKYLNHAFKSLNGLYLPTSGGTETGKVYFLEPIYANLSEEQTQTYPITTGISQTGVGIPVTIRSSVDSGHNRAFSIWSNNFTGTTYNLEFGIDRSGEFNIGNTNNFYHLNASRGRFEVRSSSSASTFIVDTLTGTNKYAVTVNGTVSAATGFQTGNIDAAIDSLHDIGKVAINQGNYKYSLEAGDVMEIPKNNILTHNTSTVGAFDVGAGVLVLGAGAILDQIAW